MLSRSRRALLALGLMPTLLWWACTATVDLDGLTGADDDEGGVVGSGGSDGSGGTGAAPVLGGMGGAGGASVTCSVNGCIAVCDQGCMECGAINDGSTCIDLDTPRSRCMCAANTCSDVAACFSLCLRNEDCPADETCDVDSGDCVAPIQPSGACCMPQNSTCPEVACSQCVCSIDASCCNISGWPVTCAMLAQDFCFDECGC